MGSFFGYIGAVVGVLMWVVCLLGVVVMVIFGLIHYSKRQIIEDPGEADPEVFKGTAPPLDKGEMSPFESTAVKASLPMLIAAMLGVFTVLGFSAYGLREMAAGTKTTAKMRQEAKDQAKSSRAKYGSGPAIEDEGDTGAKKRTKSFDITTEGVDKKPADKKPADKKPADMKPADKKHHRKGKK